MRRFFVLPLLLLASVLYGTAAAQTAVVRWELRLKGTTAALGTYTTQTACDTAARARNAAGTVVYECPRHLAVTGSAPPVTCPAAPAPTVATIACAAPTTGSWQQTTTVTIGAAPACTRTTVVAPQSAPAGACTAPPVDPPPTGAWSRIASEGATFNVVANTTVRYGSGSTFRMRVVSGVGQCTNEFFGGDPTPNVAKVCESQGGGLPTPSGGAFYFAPDGNNANPGTQASPKRDASGINMIAAPAGTQYLFQRGGTYTWQCREVDNKNVTGERPLVIDAYGTGARPIFNVNGCAINWGNYNAPTGRDGGYRVRNIEWRGTDRQTAFFHVFDVTDVVYEGNLITGFYKAFDSQSRGTGVRGIQIRNNDIVRNSGMGVAGSFSDSVIDGNLFEGNNFSGSGFDHAIYLSGGGSNLESRNNQISNNRFINNSVVNGRCTGGQVTFHGQFDGMLIEGNRIESPNAQNSCWHMSITQAYDSAEWFRNFIVRNNKSFYPGNTGFNAQSAPGIVFEGNVIVTNQNTTAIGVGHGEYQNGDVADGNAVVRNNTQCQQAGAGQVVRLQNAPNSVNTGNTVLTGPAASAGVCAR